MEKPYPYVRAWYEEIMLTTEQRVRNMIQAANDEDAPETAVFRRMDASWATITELGPMDQLLVKKAVAAKEEVHLIPPVPGMGASLCRREGKTTAEINFVTCQKCRDRHELIIDINEEEAA